MKKLQILIAKLRYQHRAHNLQRRFIFGVLLPPFIVLMLLSLVILWQMDKFVRNQAIGSLDRSATTTAAKLEREFAIRKSVLQRTGEDLFGIKNNYQTGLADLESDRAACSSYVQQKKTFQGAPNNVCDPFLSQFAKQGINLAAIEEGYVSQGKLMADTQTQAINDRLTAYQQFFPETLGLVVLDDKGEAVSSAFAGVFKSDPVKIFLPYGQKAVKTAVEGTTLNQNSLRIGVFAYPIDNGSVLAAYDLDSPSFMKQTWQSTPIDKKEALAVIMDAEGNLAYPSINLGSDFKAASRSLRTDDSTEIKIGTIGNVAVGAKVGSSNWLVTVASPKAAVLAPVRDAQLAAVFVIGCLLVGFLWVGTYFIKRTMKSVYGLVGGALVFAAGKLDYKITLHDADEEFDKLAETMNGMAERIAKAEKEIDEKNKEFISVATHELRTPLTAIMGNLSMVVEDMGEKLDPMVKPVIDQAHKGTMRLRDLVNDMLDVARLEGGRTEFKIAPLDVSTIISGVVDSLQIVAQEKPVTLTYHNKGAASVMADEPHFKIVITNFVSNAIKYNRPNGTVQVYHGIHENTLITAVKDTGLGIPEDQKAHMFEKFFRVDNEDRKSITGTGLGMYITKQYILAMGGQVWFDSVHGQGTTFCFTLPLAPPPQTATVQAEAPASPVPQQPQPAGVVGQAPNPA